MPLLHETRALDVASLSQKWWIPKKSGGFRVEERMGLIAVIVVVLIGSYAIGYSIMGWIVRPLEAAVAGKLGSQPES